MHAHHLISLVSFFITLHFNNFTVVFGIMLLHMEISTTYICIRWLLYTHKLERTTLSKVNLGMGAFTFLFGRLCFQIYISLAFGFPMLFNQIAVSSFSEILLLLFLFSAILLSIVMNSYWMWLIIRQIVRVIISVKA
jgi:hypothetical protein